MKPKEIKQKVQEEGYIQAIIIFEVAGSPKKYVEDALTSYLQKLKDEKDVEVIKQDVEPAEEQDKVWGALAEVEILVKGLEKFTWLCMNFMPSSIEIMAPDSMAFKGRDLTNWLNDLLAKLHEIGLISQQVGEQNRLMLRNMNSVTRNAVLICLDSGVILSKDIAVKIGFKEKDLKPVLQAMIKENTIKKEGRQYSRK